MGQVIPGTASTTCVRLALFAAGAVLAADLEVVAAGGDLPAFDSHPARTGPAKSNKVQPRITILLSVFNLKGDNAIRAIPISQQAIDRSGWQALRSRALPRNAGARFPSGR